MNAVLQEVVTSTTSTAQCTFDSLLARAIVASSHVARRKINELRQKGEAVRMRVQIGFALYAPYLFSATRIYDAPQLPLHSIIRRAALLTLHVIQQNDRSPAVLLPFPPSTATHQKLNH